MFFFPSLEGKSPGNEVAQLATNLKFELRWFPDEAGFSAEKVYTDIPL